MCMCVCVFLQQSKITILHAWTNTHMKHIWYAWLDFVYPRNIRVWGFAKDVYTALLYEGKLVLKS